MAREFTLFNQHASVQNKLQAMAGRLQKAKQLEARAKGEVDRVRTEFYGFCDAAFGENTYVIYEARGELRFNRMVREIQEPREFDVEAMKMDARLPEEARKFFIKEVVDTKALDVALAARTVDSRAIAEHTNFGARANLLWTPTGARTEIRPKEGQIAVVSSKHLVVADQEGAA